MATYKYWELLDEMPDGWVLDRAGSPLHGYQFVTNGKSVVNGQQRALLKVVKDVTNVSLGVSGDATKFIECVPGDKKPTVVIDSVYKKTVNDLARAKFKQKLLGDIIVDLTICELEGWDKSEYIKEIVDLVCGLGKRKRKEIMDELTLDDIELIRCGIDAWRDDCYCYPETWDEVDLLTQKLERMKIVLERAAQKPPVQEADIAIQKTCALDFGGYVCSCGKHVAMR